MPKGLINNKEPAMCCGMTYRNHPKCNECGILVGEEHFIQELINYNGKKYCPDCLGRREKGIPSQGYDPRYFKPNKTSH